MSPRPLSARALSARDADALGAELALAAGRGDRAALGEFIALLQPDVWRFCAHLSTTDAADDLTQDTFIRAMDALPRFRGEASARSWLLTIARRVVADRVRHEMARPRSVSDGALPDRPSPCDLARRVEMRQLMGLLDLERREAFVLTQVVGLTYVEAAEVIGVPVGTIRSRVARARAHLLELYSQASEDSLHEVRALVG